MKSKTFIFLLLLCGVLVGVEYFLFNQRMEKNQPKFFGKLFEFVSANDIEAIQIISPGNSVKLRKADIWQVENRYNFPANFTMIIDFIMKFKYLKVDRSFKSTEETISRLALRRPDEKGLPENQKGTRIIFQDKNMEVLADMILGAARESSAGGGGSYLKFVKEDTIHLVDKNLNFLDKESSKWLDKDLVKAAAEEIESVTCLNPVSKVVRYAFKRPEKGKEPEVATMPADKKIEKLVKSKVSSLFGAIASFQCDDLAEPAKTIVDTGLDTALLFEFHLFDGRIYRIYPGKAVEESPEKYYFKVNADYADPPGKPEAASKDSKDKPGDKQKKEAEKKQKQTELSEQIKAMNKKLSAWTFIVPKWRHDNFITDPADFFEKEKAESQK
ncbi:MAG: hypothetical protein BWK80_31625 [Desulfobacteraceae bacterium IS3]|nr:MAG: hypothetical protein BWK80_31625 [Desulfobacteraceae bacterium IS3]HAO20299.1 hypothetical protein [Desulfobacteraceae bacterium]